MCKLFFAMIAGLLLQPAGAQTTDSAWIKKISDEILTNGKAYENLENSVLEEVVVCDTIPVKKQSPKIRVISVAELFAVAIRNAFENKSITSLFIHSQRKDK